VPRRDKDGGKFYSLADIRKKLSAAGMLLDKNKLQFAVYQAYDAISMIQQLHPEARGEAPATDGSRLGAEGGAFRKAVIREPLDFAIGLMHEGQWDKAVTQIRLALARMQQLADSKNEALEMCSTPPGEEMLSS